MVSFIVAIDRNLLIGDAQGIPWHLPADLKRFRRLTLGKPIVMGRTTFEHIGRPLDRRVNIVMTRQADDQPDGVLIARSANDAVALAGDVPEMMVIGGGEVFRAFLNQVSRLYLTVVHGEFSGTAFFPSTVPAMAGHAWRERSREEFPADEKNAYPTTYRVFDCVEVGEEESGALDLKSIVAG